MNITVSKTKTSETFYVTKSFRDKVTKKNTSKTIERLGTKEELQNKLGQDVDVYLWAKEYARELTQQEKEATRTIGVSYNPSKLIEQGVRHTFGGGHLFLQSIYHELGLDTICAQIDKRHRHAYDLNNILSNLIFGRILHPSSKLETAKFAKSLIGHTAFDNHQVYRALEVLHEETDFIQAELYKNSASVIGRKTGMLYFDCTNFYFEIEQEDAFRKYGPSKEHRPNPLVQMGLFMDAEGMPLAFCMSEGSKSEQKTLVPLEQKILDDFALSKFITCTDAGLSSLANRKFNAQAQRHFVTTQSIKKLKSHLKKWALDPKGWHIAGTEEKFDLDKLHEVFYHEKTTDKTRHALLNQTFYKSRRVKEKDSDTGEHFEQNLIVTFSFKYLEYARKIRNAQIERALKAIEKDTRSLERKGQNDFRRFVEKTSLTPEGEVADKSVFALNEEVISREEQYDGFYGLATSLDVDDIPTLLKVNARRWEIEECFRIMKTEFGARPVYLSREERIRAHFLTCFISLLIYRVLEKKLGGQFTCEEIIDTLRSMDFEEIRGEGWHPLYTRTELTDALHEAFGFRTDYEIVTNAGMRKIISTTKKK